MIRPSKYLSLVLFPTWLEQRELARQAMLRFSLSKGRSLELTEIAKALYG